MSRGPCCERAGLVGPFVFRGTAVVTSGGHRDGNVRGYDGGKIFVINPPKKKKKTVSGRGRSIFTLDYGGTAVPRNSNRPADATAPGLCRIR